MTTTTLTGLYDTYDAATRTVRALEALSVPSADISLVAYPADGTGESVPATNDAGPGAEIGASTGVVLGGGAGLLAGLGMLAIPGVGPVVAAGWLVATAVGVMAGAGAGGAAGGLIGSMISSGVTPEQAEFYAEGIRRGGSLVTARVETALFDAAEAIMERHGRIDPVTRGKAYYDGGWRRFDATSSPMAPADIARERARYPVFPLI